MPHDLEAPSGASDELYLARGSEVNANRPVMTGDVFVQVPLLSPVTGESRPKSVMVVQHPCALRSDGVNLTPGVLVAEIRRHRIVEDWTTHAKLMPLPDLLLEVDSGKRHQAALFDVLGIAASVELIPGRRIACLSEPGVCLALQRFNHHNSRIIVPTKQLLDVIGGPFEEVEITEEWCDEAVRNGVATATAAADCLAWLRQDIGDGRTRQGELEMPQHRSRIRRDARTLCRERNADEWNVLITSRHASA